MKNKRLAMRLLAKDCEIATEYVWGKQTCAVGCLALASGVSRNLLLKHNGNGILCDALEPVRERIWDKFELGPSELRHIQLHNDNAYTVKERREAVLAVVRRIPNRTRQ